MTLIRRPMERQPIPMRSAIERLLNDWPSSFTEGGALVPALDVRDAGDAYVVETELPGVNPDDVEVMIEGRTLTIRGQFAEEREQDEGNYLLRERRRGQFMRAVALPGMVEVDKVTSKYEDGELIITLPKAEQNRARRVQIEAAKSQDGRAKAQNGGGERNERNERKK